MATITLKTSQGTSNLHGSVTLTATVSNDIASSNIHSVRFFADGALVGEDFTGTNTFTDAWDSTTISDGKHTLTAKVFYAKNSVASAPLAVTTLNNSTPPPPPIQDPPANTGLPALSGVATEGQTLTCSDGTWTNSPTRYTYQWLRCDAAGANPVAIPDQNNVYTLASIDVGATIRCAVTAINAIGPSAAATSPQSGVVQSLTPAVPVNQLLPVISGTPIQGNALSSSTGSWSNSPTGYAYQWRRCDSAGANCSNITGATTNAYTAVSLDVGSTLKCRVIASNTSGDSAPAFSNQTAVVTSSTPPPTAFNWFPGHYVLVHDQSGMANAVNDALCTPFKGFQTRFYWNECETSSGNYSAGFTQMDSMLNLVSQHSGKKFIFQLQYKKNDGSHAVPTYLLSAPYCSQNSTYCGELVYGGSALAMIWNTTVNNRLGLWLAAMVSHAASSSHADLVAGFVLNETSLPAGVTDTTVLNNADYSGLAYINGIQHNLTAMRQASNRFPYIYYHEGGIYNVNAQQVMSDWLATQTHLGVGTPDLQSLNKKAQGWPGTVNQTKYPCWPAVQSPDYAGSVNPSVDAAYHYGFDPAPSGLHASVISWLYGGSGAFTFRDVSNYIPAHPTNTSLPAGW